MTVPEAHQPSGTAEKQAIARDILATFAPTIVRWQRTAGRHDLPWQGSHDAYRIWLSEIMLQQTQVATVIPYYQRFLERFPTVGSLAAASIDEVMPYWAGLGYYTRAHNLHRCACLVQTQYKGRFPSLAQDLEQLPGIGRSTAAAIAAFSHGQRIPIMDGNVQRIFARHFGIDADPGRQTGKTIFWDYANQVLDAAPTNLDMAAYTQGQMDLGATICRRSKPDCQACPIATSCFARQHDKQHELPFRRRRKAIPVRHCAMLILESHTSGFLLEKQPEPGLWAGLWSLPRFDSAAAMQAWCTGKALSLDNARQLGELTHVFSHFRLHIQPWHLQLPTLPRVFEPSANASWLPVAQLANAALPAPIRTLLEQCQTRQL